MSQPSVRALVPLAIPLLLGLNCPNTGGPPAGGEAGGEAGADGGREGAGEWGDGARDPGRPGRAVPSAWTGQYVVYLSTTLGAPGAGPEAPALSSPTAARAACAALGPAAGLSSEPLFAEVPDAPPGGSELDRFCLVGPRDGVGGDPTAALPMQRLRVLQALIDVSGVPPGPGLRGLTPASLLPFGLADATFASVLALQAPGGPELSELVQIAQTSKELGLMDPSATLQAKGAPRARVAVLDTLPTGAIGAELPGTDHGGSVAGLIQAITCPGSGPCPVELDAVQALPLVVADGQLVQAEDGQPGGFGTPATVARAVRQAALRAGGAQVGAVLNLSIGWNPLALVQAASGAPNPSADAPEVDQVTNYSVLPAGPKAVLAALIDARCRGHIAIAAGGNRSLGGIRPPVAGREDGRTGALLPARWAELKGGGPAPGCERFVGGGGMRAAPGWPAGEPLLIAVGGLGNEGQDFDRGRPGGRGPLVALADGVTVPARVSGGGSAVVRLDGTSAATAVGAGALALSWSLEGGAEPGGASAGQAWRALWTTAPGAGLPVEVGGSGDARKVDICALLRSHDPALACTPPAAANLLPPLVGVGPETPAVDCSTPSAGPPAVCAEPTAPTPDLRFQVVPQPPLGCPPCELRVSDGTPGGLVLKLGPVSGADGAVADWRTPAWSGLDRHIVRGLLEVRHGPLAAPRLATYPLTREQLGDNSDQLGLRQLSLQPVQGMELGTVRAVTLILQAEEKASPTSGPAPVSYVVGVPVVR